jgi:uncharacterized protein (TIGR00290 family)
MEQPLYLCRSRIKTNMKKAVMIWSGGKDCALALHEVSRQPGYQVECLLTTANEHHRRVSMHGVRVALVEQQAEALGLPLHLAWVPEQPDMATYEERMAACLRQMKAQGIEAAIFGDIFLEDLRQYREQQLAKLGLEAVFPLWGRPTEELMQHIIRQGFEATVVCLNSRLLPPDFLGRSLDPDFLRDLPATVDPCGENGEFHTFVSDGPLFRHPVRFKLGERVFRQYGPAAPPPDANGPEADQPPPAYDTGFWFCDLLPS